MAYFHSEKMTYCECTMPTEIAWEVMNRLGMLEIVAFQDTQINYQNPFVKSFRRCDEVVSKIGMIRGLLEQLNQNGKYKLIQAKDPQKLLNEFEKDIQNSRMQGYLYMNIIEDQILETHQHLVNQKKELDSLEKDLRQLVIELALLLTVSSQKSLKPFYVINEEIELKQIGGEHSMYTDKSNTFQSKCVCINRSDLMMFKRGLFRMTRGNSWVEQMQVSIDRTMPYLSESNKVKQQIEKFMEKKLACVVIYQKGDRNMVLHKINRFLACLECHQMKSNLNKVSQQISKIEEKIKEVQSLSELTIEGIEKYLIRLSSKRAESSVSWIAYMEVYAKKQREIYKALSSSRVSKNYMQFNIYLPSKHLPLHIQPSEVLPPLTMNIREPNGQPPSKFDTNLFLDVPQQIVNTYGVPSYGEINPAVFYIMTFGFFIGVMFGDIGHMLMTIPLLLYFKASVWFWTVTFFMGYCGLIYNQFFGLDLGIFSSCYSFDDKGVAVRTEDCMYPIGIDSVWKSATNEMQFTNSLKMKAAVIIGVVHMMFGLCIRLANDIRQKKISDMLVLTIPQIIFLICTFVYMDFIIVYKWMNNFEDTKLAPSIISTMIQIYVGLASQKPNDLLFWQGERKFQRFLVILAILMIPIMLFGKPLLKMFKRKDNIAINSNSDGYNQDFEEEEHQNNQNFPVEHKMSHEILDHKNGPIVLNNFSNLREKVVKVEEESIKELLVHQFIETIEFVLGSVSNTASYLRLWALSLAHAQLSQVIFQLIILKMLKGGYGSIFGVLYSQYKLFLAFPFYFAVTFGVLICMDSMECFLHSLRLHWVEFQNKFYSGKGYQFVPFMFSKVVNKR